MEDNLYRPPTAPLLLPETTSTAFYAVSIIKFWVLSIATAGLYRLYWHYKNWALYRASTGHPMWPVMRAIFSIFFTHSLFREVDARLRHSAIDHRWDGQMWATIYVVITLIENVTDRLAGRSVGSPITDFISIAAMLLATASLQQAQRAINVALGDPEGTSNSQFTIANWIWIVVGVLLWVLILAGIFLEVSEAA
jgi:hypothetical protein